MTRGRHTLYIGARRIPVERAPIAARPAAASRFEVVVQPGGPIRPIAREVEDLLRRGPIRIPRILHGRCC